MGEWQSSTLGALIVASEGTIKTGPFGSQLHAHEYIDDQAGVPVVMPKDMVGGRISTDSVKRVSEDTAQRLHVHRLSAGDLVLARRGDIGRLVSVAPDEKGWLCGTGSMRIHAPDHDVVDPGFLRYVMQAPATLEWLAGQAVGATMPNLNAEIVSSVPLAVPGIRLQRRIAGVLSAFDELIEINERRIEILEVAAEALYREWFERHRYPGHSKGSVDATNDRPAPEGWETCRLRDVVTTQYGVTASASESSAGPQFLRGMDINKRSFINWDSVPHCDIGDTEVARFLLKVGDICVIRMANPGKAGIVERDIEAVFGSYLVRFASGDRRLTPYLLYYFLRSRTYQEWVDGSSTGSTRKSASAAVLTEPWIVLPTAEIAEQFERNVGALRKELSALVEGAEALARTRDLLLSRLVTGQLDISDVDLGILAPAEPE